MRIPEKVRIGGLEYSVELTKPGALGIEFEGQISYRDQRMLIHDTGTDYAKITFLHECVHGMLDALGLSAHNQDEKLVDGLAHQLYQLIEGNPEMFELSQKEEKQ